MKQALRLLVQAFAWAVFLAQPQLALSNDVSNPTWSETDASNNSPAPNGWTGSTRPAQVEPGLRSMAGGLKRWYDHANAVATSTGAANAQVLTYAVLPEAYRKGDEYAFIAGFTNTGSTTINVCNSGGTCLGPKLVRQGSATLDSGSIAAGRAVTVYYDGTDFQILGGGVTVPAGGPSALGWVANNAALALAVAGDFPNGLLRIDYAAGVGAPILYFTSQSGTCAANSMANDAGRCTDANDGNSWISHPDPDGIDIRQFGAVGTSDDTAIFTAADTAMGQAAWPTGVAKVLWVPAMTVNILNWNASNINGLMGRDSKLSTINLASSGTTADDIMTTNSPIEIANLNFTCPIRDPVTLAAPPGRRVLTVQSLGTPLNGVKLHNLVLTGCQNGLFVTGAQNVDIHDVLADRQERLPIDIIGGNIPGSATEHVNVYNVHCIGSGYYCASTVNTPVTASANAAPRGIHLDISAVATGYKYTKGTLDLVSGAQDSVTAKVFARNSKSGLDLKSTGVVGINTIPPTYKNFDTELNFFTHADFTQAATYITTDPFDAFASDQHGRMKNKTFATYTVPEDWAAGVYKGTGEMVTYGGNTYMAQSPGTTGVTGPTHTGLQISGITLATGGSGCPNGVQTFAALNGDQGGTWFDEVQVSGTVVGGVLQAPLTLVSGWYWSPPSAAVRINADTACATPPTVTFTFTGATTVQDGDVYWAYMQPTVTRGTESAAVQLGSTQYTDVDVTAYNYGQVVRFAPQGYGDIKHITIKMVGDNVDRCLFDQNVVNPDRPETLVDDVKFIEPHCHALTTPAIYIGTAATHSGVDYKTNYTNLKFFGGSIEVDEGSVLRDHWGSGTPASVQMSLYGTRLVGFSRVFQMAHSPWDITMYGGHLETTDSSTPCLICSGTDAANVVTFTAPQEIAVTNPNPTSAKDWLEGAGSTLTVNARLIDGYDSTAPTALTRRCNWGQIVRSQMPGSGGQPVNGWYCSDPATSAWTSF